MFDGKLLKDCKTTTKPCVGESVFERETVKEGDCVSLYLREREREREGEREGERAK